MAEPWSIILTAIKTGKTVFDENQRKTVLRKLKLLFRKNKKIIVFGISGAGKSQFIQCLLGKSGIPNRTLTTDKVKFGIEDFPIIFWDTPGHTQRDSDRKKALAEIMKENVIGVINVISFGYEENPESEIDAIFDANGDVKESFLNQNRTLEIERLSEWLPFISSDKTWVLNIVNKADLWWDHFEEVDKYYSKGNFMTAFRGINNKIQTVNLPYCSLIRPYYDTKTSGRFGDIDKHDLHNYLMHQLVNLLKG